MKSTYKITITESDSFGRFNVYNDATVADMAQLLNHIAKLDKSEWNVDVRKNGDDPYSVNIFIEARKKDSKIYTHYTLRIEDGEASE